MSNREDRFWLDPEHLKDIGLTDVRILIFVLQIIFNERRHDLLDLLSMGSFIGKVRLALIKGEKFLTYANNFHNSFLEIYQKIQLRFPHLNIGKYANALMFTKTDEKYQKQMLVLAQVCRKFEIKPGQATAIIGEYLQQLDNRQQGGRKTKPKRQEKQGILQLIFSQLGMESIYRRIRQILRCKFVGDGR